MLECSTVASWLCGTWPRTAPASQRVSSLQVLFLLLFCFFEVYTHY